ncbi:hypothetical protein [Patiriisocius sp. Uisw_017]|jgi:hypothetical protein|uniref:hypothetical protein n=1 Tax=Patiriisocius sp. Uisw_017 TaxID=3230968 RepID=UPI0039E868D2
MKAALYILFFLAVISAIYGFYIGDEDPEKKHLFIGLGVVFLFLLWMPAFVYHRWKDKKVSNYMLDKDNIYKMRNYTDNNKL